MHKKHVMKRFMALFIIAVLAFTFAACGDDEDPDPNPTPPNGDNGDNGDNDFDYHDLSVRDAKGDNGMVATASSYASKVGLDILQAGGTAFDAAIAISFALGVTEPNASGIGGGGFMVAYNAETGERIGYDYREFAPEAATLDLYRSNDDLNLNRGNNKSTVAAFGIPMLVDGMMHVHEDLGTMPLEDLMNPAIDLARDGFEVPPALAGAINSQWSKLRENSPEESLNIYSLDGFSPITTGELLINEDLANVLELVRDQGREGFYTGDVALAIVNAVQEAGGIATMSDFHHAIGNTRVSEPITGTYQNYDIISMVPPSSGGTTLAQFFNMIEHYSETYGPIGELEHNSADYLHAIGSALQLAYGDRRAHLSDPDFYNIPIEGLISKAYAADRFSVFDPEVGQHFPREHYYGTPENYQNTTTTDAVDGQLSVEIEETENPYGSTTHFTVIDSAGNIVSATHTINYFFGNGIIVPGTGIALNNTMSPFSMNPNNETAQIAPFKRPLSNMSPTIVLKDDEPFMAIGSPGSMRITSAIVQTFLNVVEFDMDVQSAIEAPRIFHYVGSAVSPYNPAPLEIEGDIGADVINELEAMGYIVSVYSGTNLYFGGVHAIVIDPETGEMHGGADTRRDGKALGY